MQVAVQRLEHEQCSWKEVLSPESRREHSPAKKTVADADLRQMVQSEQRDNGSGYAVTRRWDRDKLDVPL